MIKSIWFTRQFISYQKMTLASLKLYKKFKSGHFIFFLSRITELWFSDAWQFKNYREIIIAALIHIGFVIFVWLQKTAVLSSYYGPPNSGPRNAHTELDGVSGLPISLKYLGVHKKGSPFILPYPTCLLDNERNLETTLYYAG